MLWVVGSTPRSTMSPTLEEQAEKFQNRMVTDSVYELLPEPNPDVELVFFHGLQMTDSQYAFWRIWKMRQSEDCWPEVLLPQKLIYNRRGDKGYKIKARVLSISYEGRLDLGGDGRGNGRSDEYLISESLMQELLLVDVGQRHRVPVFLIGHDLGGILIKQLVMMAEHQGAMLADDRNRANKFLENLKSVFFYATPHCGSEAIEQIAAQIDEKDENQMLRLMKLLNKETARTNEAFQEYRLSGTGSKRSRFTSHAVHASHITNKGGFKHVLVVPEGSARAYVDSFYTVQADHFSVCQPEDSASSPLQLLSDQIIKEVRASKGDAL